MRRSDKAAAFLFASAIVIALVGLGLVTDSGPMDASKSIPMVAVSIFVAACLCTAAVLWARGGPES